MVLGFNHHPERHFELLRLLNAEFGTVALLRPWDNETNAGDLTINILDQNNKQIIILYNDNNVIEGKSIYLVLLNFTLMQLMDGIEWKKAWMYVVSNGLNLCQPFPHNYISFTKIP